MTSAFVGEAQSKGKDDPEDLFRVDEVVPGDKTRAALARPAVPSRSRSDPRPCLPDPGRRASRINAACFLNRCFMTQLLLFNVTNGLIIGAFYVLMALGLS